MQPSRKRIDAVNAAPIPVLLVDDDPAYAAFVQQLIKSLGAELPCATTWACNAADALKQLQEAHYDLVLLDYNLPDGDGLQVLEKIRGLSPADQPAVVMLTGSGSEKVAVSAMKRGAKDYLRKEGLQAPELTRAIHSALAQKRLEDQVSRYHAQVEEELRLAHELQQALLPRTYPCFPRHAAPAESALRFCHRYCPSPTLAGDFFYVLPLSDTQAGLLICDVMGHGVRSALVTAMLRALVQELVPLAGEPGSYLAALNHRLVAILQQRESPLYATAFYAVVDCAAARIRSASAGHPSPLLLRRQAAHVEPLPLASGHAGPALGLFDQGRYRTGETEIAAGDGLLLYTDGLYETADQAGQDYGRDRLHALVQNHLQLAVDDLLTEVLGEVRRFSGQEEFADDVCLLGVEIARAGGRAEEKRRLSA